ncbi:hypothetical protein [Actinosynnema mirum]|uniref:Uncharacterized protein n=1 Tax=Actinosynnema mirum (strain ATCC 29888 / DSM 43827 / JCM 3225 / NBRC 14064 / NCIMB 13271 / NRRL B-12336 / IMRU 3971 / 101) TaxID=446462 RepID=C6WB81_ACTMD|nr:hypothetical protein [Actinosynnema mirum]ACU39372.1 hypothetical protein Amir_5554 [Actinosynnema mirum DSM 43827]
MTNRSEPTPDSRACLQAALRAAGTWRDGMLVTRAVVIVQTVHADGDGHHRYALHRLHPVGETDPSSERGLLSDALDDARHERHPA